VAGDVGLGEEVAQVPLADVQRGVVQLLRRLGDGERGRGQRQVVRARPRGFLSDENACGEGVVTMTVMRLLLLLLLK
jgi:hypothetical protein